MCISLGPSCRLCLTENILEPYYFILENESLSDNIGNLLNLQTRLYDASLYPNHICQDCKLVADAFTLLRDKSLENEKFILKYQSLIKSLGLTEAKAKYENIKQRESGEDLKHESEQAIEILKVEFFTNDNYQLEDQIFLSDVESNEENNKKENIPQISNDNPNEETRTPKSSKSKTKSRGEPKPVVKSGPGFCKDCSKDFVSYKAHRTNFHKEGSHEVECPKCKKTFWGQGRLKSHLMSHDDVRLECPKCPGKTFARTTYYNHCREAHRIGKIISCTQEGCDVKFRKNGDMVRHVAIVHRNKKELCMQCGDCFKNLKYHIKSVHEGVRYSCTECNKHYKTERMLKHHVIHTHELKRSICDICAVEVIDIKSHKKLKHGAPIPKTEACPHPTCGRKFRTTQEAIKHHKSLHLEVKEMCQVCGGWFKALYQHMNQVHQNYKKHTCSECGKGFSKKHDLFLHRNRVHLGIRYVCPHCGKQVSKLKDHMKTAHDPNKQFHNIPINTLVTNTVDNSVPQQLGEDMVSLNTLNSLAGVSGINEVLDQDTGFEMSSQGLAQALPNVDFKLSDHSGWPDPHEKNSDVLYNVVR